MKNWKQILLPFFLMFTAILLDGFVSSVFSMQLNTNIGLIIPRFVFLVLIILCFHYESTFMYVNAALIGFVMDSYYLGFLGVYLASFIMIILIVMSLKRTMNANVLSYTILSILGLTASELMVYGIMRILGITSIAFQAFIVSRLSATLLFNAFIMLVFSYFIHRFIVDLLDE